MIRELDAALALVEKATEGPWRWSENGNILGHMPNGYDDSREVCAVYTDDEATGAPNAPAIIAAVNFLRQHGPALREAVRDAERYRWLRSHNGLIGIQEADDYYWLREDRADFAIDSAMKGDAAAEGRA